MFAFGMFLHAPCIHFAPNLAMHDAEEEDEAAGAKPVDYCLEDNIWPKLAVGVFDFLDTTALG